MNAQQARERLNQRIHVLNEKYKNQYNQVIKSIQACIDNLQEYKTSVSFYFYEPIDVSVLEQLKKDGYNISITSDSYRNETTYTVTIDFKE